MRVIDRVDIEGVEVPIVETNIFTDDLSDAAEVEGVKVLIFANTVSERPTRKMCRVPTCNNALVLIYKDVLCINSRCPHEKRIELIRFYKDKTPSPTCVCGEPQVDPEINTIMIEGCKNEITDAQITIRRKYDEISALISTIKSTEALIESNSVEEIEIEHGNLAEWRIDGNYLWLHTKYLSSILNETQFYWGEFMVAIDIMSNLPTDSRISFYNLSRYEEGMNGYLVPHPHVIYDHGDISTDEGDVLKDKACLGEYGGAIEGAIMDKDYQGVVNNIIRFLMTVDSSDEAGRYNTSFKKFSHAGVSGREKYELIEGEVKCQSI